MRTFDLEAYLARRRQAVDRALERCLPRERGCGREIWKAMRYGLFPGGKRIRPILTLAAGEVFGGRPKQLLPFACAIEMIHAYSLIHDDLPALDNDDLRRGLPTAHKVFGEGLALLAGDGLLTEAFQCVSGSAVRSLEPKLALDLIHELAHAAGAAGLVGGQATDLLTEEKRVDLATVESMHKRKTGALLLASVRIGGRAGGANPAQLRRIAAYGKAIGLAFQIADDILDCAAVGGEESARKEMKKATYPSVVGLAQARRRLDDLTRRAIESLAPFGDRAEPLRAIAAYLAERASANRH